ncbi:MAG: hypothetical protein ACM3XO_26775 [Bacteroidota bacterium]
MKIRSGYLIILLFVTIAACSPSNNQEPTLPAPPTASASHTFTSVPSSTETSTFVPPTETSTPLPSETATPSPLPVVESLKAKVTADLLSCRYGPGAEYLYLYALRAGANIQLIGRTDANNWVWVDGKNKCWVNTKFLEIAGDWKSLPVVYPGIAKLPISPYYRSPAWANATRKGNSVEVNWEAVPISAGKYEDENMHQYIVEVWRCEQGQIVFETLGTSLPYITIPNDEAGCSQPSHGNVWLQEKHGFAGPVEIPWPAQ